MAALWIRGRTDLRRRWASLLLLVVLTSLAGGVVIGAVAGARRTDTAMARFVEEFRPNDGEVDAETDADLATIAARPEVKAMGRQSYVLLDPSGDGNDLGTVNFFIAGDARTYRRFDRLRVVSGQMFRYDRPYEIVLDDQAAARTRLRVGSHLTAHAYTADQDEEVFNSAFGHFPDPSGPTVVFRVVGIVRRPLDLVPVQSANAYLPPAFAATPAGKLAGFRSEGVTQLRLRAGVSAPDFARLVPRVLAGASFDATSQDRVAATATQRSIRVQALALLLFGGLAALAATVVLGQALARQVQLDADAHSVLRALGFTRRQLIALGLLRAGVVAVLGSAGAVVVAVALSPLMPIGIARRAEIHPGVEANVAILAGGCIALGAGILARAALPVWRAAHPARRDNQTRPTRVRDALARAGLPAPLVAGVHLSVDRTGGGERARARTAAIGVAAAVTGVVAALGFTASLDRLVADRVRQGWNWDVIVGNPNAQLNSADEYIRVLERDKTVGADATLSGAFARVAGRSITVIGWQPGKGHVGPPILDGRLPASAGEIALAADTMRAAHTRVGESVLVDAGHGSRPVRARVVGRVLMPGAAAVDFDVDFSLGRGAVMTQPGLHQVLGGDTPVPRVAAVRFAPGVDKVSAIPRFKTLFGRILLTDGRDVDVENLRRVRALPRLLALLVSLMGVGSLAHALLTSVQRRQRDFAVMKTLGFARRQVHATVAWNASGLALVGLVLGAPIGVVAGRSAWTLVCRSVIGTEPVPIVPLAGVLATAAAVLLVANLLAAYPGWAAARIRPARALRIE